MRTASAFVLMLLMAGCSGKNISTRNIQSEALPENTTLVEEDIFSVDGVKHFASLVDASLDKNSFSSAVIRPIVFRLPDEKTEKVDAEDRAQLLQAFEDAKAEVFEGFPLSDQVQPDWLVISTYLLRNIASS
jgi:hypothetical protein